MKVLIIANNDGGLYSFRRELVERLLQEHEVHISVPSGRAVEKLVGMGCTIHLCEFDRHGTNPVKELGQVLGYCKLLRMCRPDVVLTYTIKPNVYGGMACRLMRIPYIANITGLHGAVEDRGILQTITVLLHRIGLRKAKKVFFQNQKNLNFMLEHKAIVGEYEILPGSGVNLEQHSFEPYPEKEEQLVFLMIGRLMKGKGTGEILEAAEKIAKEYANVIFRFIGDYEDDYRDRVDVASAAGYVEYMGYQSDVHSFIKNSHATIHASHREGMSNVLLETAAAGRPVIATDIPGCRETFEDGVSGLSCRVRDAEDLTRAIREFIEMPYGEKAAMGAAGRRKVEKEFNRQVVVDAYMKEIERIRGTK